MSWLGWCILAAGVYLVVVLVRGFAQLALTVWDSYRESREMRERMAKYRAAPRPPAPPPPPPAAPSSAPAPPVQLLSPQDPSAHCDEGR